MNAESAVLNYLSTLNYSIDARPVYNSSGPILVWMAARLLKIIDFTSEERLTLMATLMTAWTDKFMVWDPTKFGGVNVVYRRADTIWKCSPFTLWNAASGTVYYILNGSHPLILQSDGTVSMDQTSIYSVVCEMDVAYFPWDKQRCQVQIKPSMMDLNHLVIEPAQNISLIAVDDPSNSEWQLDQSSVAHYVRIVQVMSGLYFPISSTGGFKNMSIYYLNLTLVRNPSYYVCNIIAPVCIITALSLVSFFVPGASGERIGLTISTFLSFSVLQSYVNNFVPRAQAVPMITMYILSQMILSGICVMSGVLTLLFNSTESRMPRFLRRAVFAAARFLCIHVDADHIRVTAAECEHARKHHSHENNKGNAMSERRDTMAESVPSLDSNTIANSNSNAIRIISNGNGSADAIETIASESRVHNLVLSNGVMSWTTSMAMAMANPSLNQGSKKSCKCRLKTDWDVFSEVVSRIVLIFCFLAIVTLTLFFLLTMQIDGSN